MIRVFIADDQLLIRQGLRALLVLEPEIEIAGEAGDGDEATRLVSKRNVDVLLLDIRMPKKNGIDVLRELSSRNELPSTLILTTFDDADIVLDGVRAGASGFLLKDVSYEQLVSAIRAVAAGETVFQPAVTQRLLRASDHLRTQFESLPSPERLTDREVEVVRLMAGGYSNREIAHALSTAEGTIKNHVSNILQKFGVRDRTRAVLKALEHGLLVLLAIVLTSCATAPRASDRYRFHSNPWINLHHVLYDAAQAKHEAPEAAGCVDAASVDFYRKRFGKRDLLFDDELVKIKEALRRSDALADDIPRDVRDILASAAPTYRQRCWEQHDKTNRAWIKSAQQLLDRFGAPIIADVERLLRKDFGDQPIDVDATYVANWAGAYTTLEPTHLTIASGNPGNQGNYALEIVIHETAHSLIRPVINALFAEGQRIEKKIPRDLWHVVLFYTTGEIVRRQYAAAGIAYVPFAQQANLYTGTWKTLFDAIERDWKPYMDGAISFDEAIRRLIADTV